jgi:hypothetical protein
MEIPIEQPGFEGRGLALVTAGFFSGPKVMVDGQPVAKEKGLYVVTDSGGQPVSIRLRPRFLDPVPNLEIAGRVIELARPLKWYENVWIGFPIVLALHGGAIGALFGFAAYYAGARIFRSDRSGGAKYALTGAISLAAVIAFLIVAVVVSGLIEGARMSTGTPPPAPSSSKP